MMARSAARGIVCLCMLACSTVAFGQSRATPLPTVPVRPTAPSAATAPNPTGKPHPLFADLFKPLMGDFEGLGAHRNLLLAGVGVGAAATSHGWDHPVSVSKWGGSVHEALEPGQLVGGFLFQSGAALTTYVIGRATGSERTATLGARLFRAQVVAQTTTQALKVATRRTRPDGSSLSFPSGHSAAAFATASVLQSDLGWKVGVPAYAVATWVAASRIQMRRHYVSDVVVGATVGLMAGRSVTVGRGSTRFALSPMVVPGGVGVTALKIGDR